MSFPRLSIGKILTFAVMFLIVAAILRVAPIPENVKNWFRV